MSITEANRAYWRKLNREYAQNVLNLELFHFSKEGK